jgi:eukaryotic-like serine/threonine-protein kinase
MANDPRQVQAVFLQALDVPPDQRPTFLDRECGGDGDLRRRVEGLLRAHGQSGSFLDHPAAVLDPAAMRDTLLGEADSPTQADIVTGGQVGPYRLLQKLGEGGMGAVWVAEQEHPVRRRVALKLIKPGMDSTRVVARFEAERQARALMDHTNIARVLDAGATANGLPYFVMELVQGVPITRYCDEHNLPIRERLGLFVSVCQAVQHAHQKGVIHRDLKPPNVLVCLEDGKPVPKVIDFGIAKAVGEPLTDASVHTEVGQVIGTLEYMSPEQAGLPPPGLDTRADIYSLGVLLYELLTGQTPLTQARRAGANFAEMLRRLREEEPARPSRRLLGSKEALADVAAKRGASPAQLRREVGGDLDWIAMKCLEKGRDRRYETANGLARDVERYLADEPVEATPPSAGYRLGKFARRHKAALAVAAGFLLLTYAGACGVYLAYRRAAAAEGQAQENEAWALGQEEKARASAWAEAAEKHKAQEAEADTRAFADFLAKHVLAATRPEGVQRGVGVNVTMAEALTKAEPALEKVFRGRPKAEALARHEIGVTWRNLGKNAEAIRHLERACALRREALGEDDPLTWHSTNSLAMAYQADGKLGLAIPLYARTLKAKEAKLGSDDLSTLLTRHNLAGAYLEAGRLDLAIPLLERTLKAEESRRGDSDPITLAARNNLAGAYRRDGQLDRAIPLLERTLKAQVSRQGVTHAETLLTQHNLAGAYQDAGKLDLAIPLLERTLKAMEATLSDGHPSVISTRNSLAVAYMRNKQLDRSVPLFEDLVRRAKPGDTHPRTFVIAFNLGASYRDARRLKEAVAVYDEWLPRAAAALAPEQPPLPLGRRLAAAAYSRAGQHDKAIALLSQEVAVVRKGSTPSDPRLAVALTTLGLGLIAARRHAEAEPPLRESLAIRERQEPDSWATFAAKALLGASLLGQKKYAEAERPLLDGYAGMKQREAKIPANELGMLRQTARRLVQLYVACGQPAEAARWREVLEAMKKS